MAKIAAELERALARRARNGEAGRAEGRAVAQGAGWSVRDVVCTSGPQDRPFEEEHSDVSISIVVAGTFHYRSAAGHELMTPGSLLLGTPGRTFECGHEHGAGDRCVSFQYAPWYFEQLVDAKPMFRSARVPPIRTSSPVVARACAGLAGSPISWEELSVALAVRAVELADGRAVSKSDAPATAIARVTRAVRALERRSDEPLDLATLASETGLSRYHFLRTFERVTGVTPHQYLLRARMRDAAMRLMHAGKVVDVALDCGFGDVSNFNRTFRAEFGTSPRHYREGSLGSPLAQSATGDDHLLRLRCDAAHSSASAWNGGGVLPV